MITRTVPLIPEKVKELLIVLGVLIASTCFMNCDNEDSVDPSLCKNWVLVSYTNETGEILKEAKGYSYHITFSMDGTYSGFAYGNDMWGEFSTNGNSIHISSPIMTKMLVVGSDPDMFFQEHLSDAYAYSITNEELRIYYLDNYYFKFRIKDN